MKTILLLSVALALAAVVACGNDTNTPAPEPIAEGTLQDQLNDSMSDDARTVDESQFHALARAEVLRSVLPNELNVGGAKFRVKRNPTYLGGAFVYSPVTEFRGVTRYLVWWVPEGDLHKLSVYPLNAPSQLVTPDLEFPGSAGILEYPNAADVVGYVFEGQPLERVSMSTPRPETGSYTVREYRMYRALIDTPITVSEEEAIRRIAETNGVAPAEADRIIRSVQNTIMSNEWAGLPAQEIRRASDWSGETE